MIDIDGKSYELIELSGRKYQSLMDRFNTEFGENWRTHGGVKIASALLAGCLKADDGSTPTEDQVMDLPIRKINQLASQAMVLNGMSAEASNELEKN